MLKKMLIPVDGSPLADQILSQVRRLLVRQDAELMLLRVLPPRPPAARQAEWEAEIDRAEAHLKTLASYWSGEGASVRTDFRTGAPADEIVKFAESYGPGLITMSTHGRTGISRWVRGSVTERVLERTSFPCLVINPAGLVKEQTRSDHRFRRLLVPLDGSDFSARILPLVRDFATVHQSEIILYYCAILLPSPAHLEMARDFTAEEAAPLLEPHRKKLEQAGLKATIRTSMGYPPEEILDTAEREGVDLVAMTTHGRSGLSRWLYGSVAEKVLRHCRTPVLVHRIAAAPL